MSSPFVAEVVVPESFVSPAFWFSVLQIILIDVVLSGDNAVVIALACRNLPAGLRRRGLLWGVAGAVGLRVMLTAAAALLMNLPWLKLVGGVLLLWVGVKLLVPDDEAGHDISAAGHLWGAVRTIVVADFVMSLDNVIAVAGASNGNLALLVFGLLVSIPLIIWTSQVVLHLMERWPIVVVVGGGLLGWIAGAMIWSDPVLAVMAAATPAWMATLAAALGALLVVAVGKGRAAFRAKSVDLTIE